jgi:cholesterol transport system auxiliary component
MNRKFSFFILLWLTSCGPLIPVPGEAPKRYTLSHLSETQQSPLIKKQLFIEVPNASISLDSQRVAVVPKPQQIDYFADMEWSDRLPLVIQESLAYSLQNQHLYSGVIYRSDGVIPDQSLKIDIRKFNIDHTGPLKAEAEYFVQLIDVTTRRELVSQTFTTTSSLAAEPTAARIVAALDQANQQIIKAISQWLVANHPRG